MTHSFLYFFIGSFHWKWHRSGGFTAAKFNFKGLCLRPSEEERSQLWSETLQHRPPVFASIIMQWKADKAKEQGY